MTKKEKSFKPHLLLYIKGIVMGTVDLVPGVSGGTIAFITGIYEELINSLKSFTFQNIKLFFTGQFKAFWEAVNATFLLVLALGIGTGILSMVKVVLYVIEHHYIATWSFFFGLILISTFSIVRTIRSKFSLPLVICFGAGTAIAYFITSMSAAQTPNDLWFIFLCGVLAICALLMPGTSGSFVLLLMGKYQYILNALNTFKADVIAVFIGGAVVGVLSFSHVLSWLLRKHHDITIALLSGFLFGSLNKIWPWKIQVNTVTGEQYAWSIEKFNDHSLTLTEQNLLPQTYETITGASANVLPAIISALAAIAIYMIIDTIARKATPPAVKPR